MATTYVLTAAELAYREQLEFAAVLGHLGFGCRTCIVAEARGDKYGPRHEASSRCESGGRSHCTCDTCF